MYNIAIDGPAGAGKSTIAKIVAKELGYIYVDTGAMYRTMALACYRAGIKADQKEEVIEKCKSVDVSLGYENGTQKVYLNGEDVSIEIRQEVIGNMTSAIAVYGPVREILVKMQQELAAKNNVVMDGRDIGTVVLPNADLKIYQIASVETRAKRRYLENLERGLDADLETIKKEIEERDYQDTHREISPLKKAEDAIELDTSSLTLEEVVEQVLTLIQKAKEE